MMLMMIITMSMMSHPMMMLISVIILTLFISLTFYQNSMNSLFPLILILLIMGGMLTIFMYMISLCPNKKMSFNIKLMIPISIMFMLKLYPMFMKFHNEDLITIYFYPFINMLLLMMTYLFISLMIMMKMLNWISSPMKSN
uniref:NADH dehydrogenase subunit 6 n=1 Tax=Amblyomma sp. TaxID=2730045 RepID=A0A976R643_9ACAR|nr:NADH dehydrogenase subunit 6 [Amblyomma sp.]